MPPSKWKLYVEVRRDRLKELESKEARFKRLLDITVKAANLLHDQSILIDKVNKQLEDVAPWLFISMILNIALIVVITSLL